MIDRVAVSQDDEGQWRLEFYADDIRHGVSLADILVFDESRPTPIAGDGETAVAYKVVDSYGCACGTCETIRKIQRGSVQTFGGLPKRRLSGS